MKEEKHYVLHPVSFTFIQEYDTVENSEINEAIPPVDVQQVNQLLP